MADWGYRLAHGVHVVREEGGSTQIATADGWKFCSPGLRWLLRRGRGRDLTRRQVRRRLRDALSPTRVDAAAIRGELGLLAWIVNPPLGSGAPRFTLPGHVRAGRSSYAARLGAEVDAGLIAEAEAGYEHARDRRGSIEARATIFLQAAGLTGTLVLANSTLLIGDDSGLDGASRIVVTVGLLVASIALVISGVYALFAVTRTFGMIAPNNPGRIIRRSKMADREQLPRDAVAAFLLAQRRTSIVADWKLARLKRATVAFLVGIGGVAIASGALVAEALIGV